MATISDDRRWQPFLPFIDQHSLLWIISWGLHWHSWLYDGGFKAVWSLAWWNSCRCISSFLSAHARPFSCEFSDQLAGVRMFRSQRYYYAHNFHLDIWARSPVLVWKNFIRISLARMAVESRLDLPIMTPYRKYYTSRSAIILSALVFGSQASLSET